MTKRKRNQNEAPATETMGLEVPESTEEPKARQGSGDRPLCVPCSNGGETVLMTAYSTKPLVTHYRCEKCGRTQKVFRYDRKDLRDKQRAKNTQDYSAR